MEHSLDTITHALDDNLTIVGCNSCYTYKNRDIEVSFEKDKVNVSIYSADKPVSSSGDIDGKDVMVACSLKKVEASETFDLASPSALDSAVNYINEFISKNA